MKSLKIKLDLFSRIKLNLCKKNKFYFQDPYLQLSLFIIKKNNFWEKGKEERKKGGYRGVVGKEDWVEGSYLKNKKEFNPKILTF